jgi:hypothetical protein
MNIRWCALSGQGCSKGRVSNVASVATHDNRPGCAKLMAGSAQHACGAGVANLDLVTMCPAVPNLVPSRSGVAPVRGADTKVCQGGGSSRCWRGWDAGRAHLCDGELDVGNGFGRGSSGSSPANFFFLKILLSRTPFINSGGVMVRRHFPNLALPIFDVAPPSTLIRITAKIVETMGGFPNL